MAGRALRWEDISRSGRGATKEQMRAMGMARSGQPQAQARLRMAMANPEANERSRLKAEQRLATSTAMSGVFKDRPITLQGASGRRQGLVRAGVERARSGEAAPGHDWYFQHHGKLADVAAETGHDKSRVIAASVVMSPQNNPEQELAAVGALARAHGDRKARVTITPEAAAASDDPDIKGLAGKSMHPSKLDPSHLAALSAPEVRQHVKSKGVDFESIAKGGTKQNIVKAINVLRGNTKVSEAIDPISSPKVWSYHQAIKNSVPSSPEHSEFMTRMSSLSQVKGQSRMDLFGLRGSREGILSPSHPTAEDTWMQAVSTGQQLRSVNIPGRTGRAGKQSPAKFSVGEGGSANQKLLRGTGAPPSATMHAFQSKATEMAAEALTRQSGEIIPAVGVQSGSWTEARRQAGKNVEEMGTTISARSRVSQPEMFEPSGKVRRAALPKRVRGAIPGQQALF